jgi:virginiamycin B lyase
MIISKNIRFAAESRSPKFAVHCFHPGKKLQWDAMSDAVPAKLGALVFRTALLSALCAVQAFGAGIIVSTAYSVPTPKSLPEGVTLGPDGNIWFTENSDPQIGRVIPSTGAITEFVVPDGPNGAPWDIITGPDQALWYTDTNTSQIGRMTTDGVVTNLNNTITPNCAPRRMTIGADGAIWFTEYTANQIGRITVTGDMTEYPLPGTNTKPGGIAAGPPGNDGIWFMENYGNAAVEMNLQGQVIETIPLPTPTAVGAQIRLGPDNNMWFTENRGNNIGRINPTTLELTEWPVPTPDAVPGGLTAAPDGALWFTEWEASVSQIGRITTDGVISEFPDGVANSEPWDIAVGPGGTAVWWADWQSDQMATAPICALGLTASYTASTSTLNLNFSVGNAAPYTWKTWVKVNGVAQQYLWKTPIPIQMPLVQSTHQVPYPSTGGFITVVSGLYNSSDVGICEENATVSTVAQSPTTTSLTSSPNPSNNGQAVLFTATVSPATAKGTVTFYHGSDVMGTSALSKGVATLSYSQLDPPEHQITATYNGSTAYDPSTSAILTQYVK